MAKLKSITKCDIADVGSMLAIDTADGVRWCARRRSWPEGHHIRADPGRKPEIVLVPGGAWWAPTLHDLNARDWIISAAPVQKTRRAKKTTKKATKKP